MSECIEKLKENFELEVFSRESFVWTVQMGSGKVTVFPDRKLFGLIHHINALRPFLSENLERGDFDSFRSFFKEKGKYLIAAYTKDENPTCIACGRLTISYDIFKRKIADNLFSNTTAKINDVITHKAYEGRGLGTWINAELLRVAKENHCVYVELTSTPKREAANHVYQKLGFTLCALAVGPDGTNYYQYKFDYSHDPISS